MLLPLLHIYVFSNEQSTFVIVVVVFALLDQINYQWHTQLRVSNSLLYSFPLIDCSLIELILLNWLIIDLRGANMTLPPPPSSASSILLYYYVGRNHDFDDQHQELQYTKAASAVVVRWSVMFYVVWLIVF